MMSEQTLDDLVVEIRVTRAPDLARGESLVKWLERELPFMRPQVDGPNVIVNFRLKELEDFLRRNQQWDLDDEEKLEKEKDAAFKLPDALLEQEERAIRDGFPWRSVGEVLSAALRLAKGKARWQRRKIEENEVSWGDMGNIKDDLEVSVTVRFEQDEGKVETRLRLERRRKEIEEEIRRTYRPQRVRNYLRLLSLLYEDGKLTQNEETAKQAEVGLGTLKTFLKEARQRGWIKE